MSTEDGDIVTHLKSNRTHENNGKAFTSKTSRGKLNYHQLKQLSITKNFHSNVMSVESVVIKGPNVRKMGTKTINLEEVRMLGNVKNAKQV